MVRACIERLCALSFAVAGRVHAPPVARWQSAGGARVLVIAPHPDDEALGCAGTLIRHRLADDEVRIVYVSDGSASRSGGLERDQMARQRLAEAAAAVQVLGCAHYEWLGLREGAWAATELEARLGETLVRIRPDILYAPSRIDFHPEHVRVAQTLASALARVADDGISPAVRIYQAQVPLTALLTNLVSETECVAAQTRAAFRAHASQWSSLARGLRARRYAGRLYRAGREAEEFWQLSARQYAALHAAVETNGPHYMSLRGHPIYDLRAYGSGWGARRALARLVDGAA